MADRLFTIVAEFRGTTHIAQMIARDEVAALLGWAASLRTERPFGRASAYIARSLENEMSEFPPIPIRETANVWGSTASCGGDLMLANLVETMPSG